MMLDFSMHFKTLKQLIKNINGIPYIQYCTIEDYPIFPLRGFMIDVGRNFQSISILKQQLDIMARYKNEYISLASH